MVGRDGLLRSTQRRFAADTTGYLDRVPLEALVKRPWTACVLSQLGRSRVGSVILGFALQETRANVMWRLSILLERPFSEGDESQIGDHEGLVMESERRGVDVNGGIPFTSC